jgi:phosphatidylglycerol---prolipoprotein diacylglyceryl transferase
MCQVKTNLRRKSVVQMLEYPSISPILFSIGPLAIRWYSLAYIGGIGLGTFLFKNEFKKWFNFTYLDCLDFMSYIMIGVLLGGRLGYVLFYDLVYYVGHPLEIIAIWNGGMSYHGGAIGAVIAMSIFSKVKKVSFFSLIDILAVGSTVGIFLGRLANFVNGELFGRETSVPWGMMFPGGGLIVRHPSQLYEAFFEGFVLFCILYVLMKKMEFKPGIIFGLYLIGYGFFRFFCEFFRAPDPQLGTLVLGLSMGQLLCLTMISLGCIVLYFLGKITDNDV